MNTKYFFLTGMLLLGIIGLVACNPVITKPATMQRSEDRQRYEIGDTQMQVELDVFSGRPNPQWNLTTEERAELNRLLQALPEAKTEKPLLPGLGYRGFIVTALEDKATGCSEIVIFKKYVSAKCNGKLLQFTDKDRTLERWLLQTGRSHLEDSFYQQINSAIEGN
jgi:hypothetical protein